MPSAALIDEYGELSEQIKTLTKRQEAIKAKLKQLGDGIHEGTRFNVCVTPREVTTLDQVKLRSEYEDVAMACEKVTQYQMITAQRRT